jgi:5-methylcytosine-specific restriction enzyme subunit McrC
MEHLKLSEYATEYAVELTREERDSLTNAIPSLTIAPSVGFENRYDLTASSWIGAYQIGELAVEIRPKLPIERVLFLMSYSLDPSAWRDETVWFESAPTLHEAIIPAFVYQVQAAFRRGLLQGYRTEEDALHTVRGRIRFDEQIRRRFGVVPPVEVRFDEFTEDILENRLIRAAVNRLRRLSVRSPAARASLRAFDSALSPVTQIEYHPRQVPEVQWSRLNAHYRPAVTLARLILAGSVIEARGGRVLSSGFAVDMNSVFEDFVVVALREALGLSPRRFRQGDGTLRLDRAGKVTLRPDVTWWEGGRCVFAGDVKYKRIKASGILHPDLYQLLAYSVASDLPGGLLIYAAGEDEAATHEVVHVGKRLDVVTLDLAGNIEDVLGQINGVAGRVRRWRRKARMAA